MTSRHGSGIVSLISCVCDMWVL
uniref:Uncharacterized protein n=1 Tax=Anguilla anguilla TaxID=7936 RepID=A0A0E9U4M0_ANGAN